MGRNLGILLSLLIVAAAGGIGYFASQQIETPVPLAEEADDGTDAPAAATDEPAADGPVAAPARQMEEDTGPAPFAFERLQILTDAQTPEACLVFSRDLDETGTTIYLDYLAIEPVVRPGIRVAGQLLCLSGLAFGQTYSVTLREGLPAADGSRLGWDEVVPVGLQNRDPVVAFGPGLILPRSEADGVPVRTINVDRVAVEVYRVGDRLLARLRQGLVDESELYPYEASEVEFDLGTKVWDGVLETPGKTNAETLTLFPFDEAIGTREPGVYLLLAETADEQVNEYDYRARAAQWIISSDLVLTSFSGTDGLTVYVRSLSAGRPARDVRLELVARNNEILAEAVSDAEGQVRFDPGLMRGEGGSEPVAVLAYGAGEDFTYLDLRRPAFDFTDRGVGGREAPGPIDAYLYTDRGIYRAGETVQLTTLLRNRVVNALDDVPLTLSVRRPDGIEFRRLTIGEQTLGALHTPVELTRSAPLGRWQVLAFIDTNAPPVGRVAFDVQDFVPERLGLTLTTENPYLVPGGEVSITAQTRFLYGAPAAGLEGEAELRLSVDPEPHPDYADYTFGRIEELFSDRLMGLAVSPSDGEGVSLITGTIETFGFTTRPLQARISVAMYEPGGRATREDITLPVRTGPVMLGLRPAFEGRSVRRESEAAFDVIALDESGERIDAQGLTWQLIREIRRYQWYEVDGRWRYEVITRDRPVEAGRIDVGAGELGRIGGDVEWGSYRMEIVDPRSGAATSTRFYAGWGGGEVDRPDEVAVNAEKALYRPGETARVEIVPPTEGEALIVVASDRIHYTQRLGVSPEGTSVLIPVNREWGPGAYVLVTTYRPLGAGPDMAPVRGVGLTWLALDNSDRTLGIEMDLPEVAPPDEPLAVNLTLTGMGADEAAVVTLAAVDEGILQLTDFDSPAPSEHYFGKRRLALDMRDDYGRLIRNARGEPGAIRSGGDGLGASGVNSVPQRTVALFSGLVEVGPDGRTQIPLEIPDFAGELRVMAVAASAGKVGEADTPLTVRADVVADLTLPRFLAPGDRSAVTLSVHNVAGAAGTYTAALTAEGAVATGDALRLELSLAEDERREVTVPLDGLEPGLGEVALTLSGPAGFRLSRGWEIEVRPAQLPQTTRTIAAMAPDEALTLESDIVEPYLPGTATASVMLSSAPGYDVPGLLQELSRYPFGCLEQTVSRALPLLYFNDMAARLELEGDEDIKARLQRSVDRVLDMQRPDGSFTMWGDGDRAADQWMSVYALHFLVEAEARGDLVVPDDALRRGLNWMGQLARQTWRDGEPRAYAHYVLARAGRANAGDLRYFFDTAAGELTDAISLALTAGALAQIGDLARATSGFRTALARLGDDTVNGYQAVPAPYGSRLRDLAALTALAAEAGQSALVPELIERSLATRPRYTTTQEKAWMLLAAHRLASQQGRLSVAVEGLEVPERGDPMIMAAGEAELIGGVRLLNTSERELYRVLTVTGVPKQTLGSEENGMSLSKTFWNLAGGTPDLDAVRQNDRLIVVISGQMDDDTYREMAVLDLLPAGFEIESVIRGDSQGRSVHRWLPTLTPLRMSAKRDDRFVAAFDIGRRYRPENEAMTRPNFNIAYMVRAVAPGRYALPAVRVEDMYDPAIWARTDVDDVTITAAP